MVMQAAPGWNLLTDYLGILGNVNLVDRLGMETLNRENSKIQVIAQENTVYSRTCWWLDNVGI